MNITADCSYVIQPSVEYSDDKEKISQYQKRIKKRGLSKFKLFVLHLILLSYLSFSSSLTNACPSPFPVRHSNESP